MDYSQIDINKIKYNNPCKINNKYLGKIIYDSSDIIIRTPYLRAKSELITGRDCFYFELELGQDDIQLYEFLSDMDDINIDTAFHNSKVWFKEQIPLDVVDEYYKPLIRLSKKKIPYIRIKNYAKDIYLKEGQMVSVLMKLDGLRFFKQSFMPEWKILEYQAEEDYVFDENTENLDKKELENEDIDNVDNNNNSDDNEKKVDNVVEELVNEKVNLEEIEEDKPKDLVKEEIETSLEQIKEQNEEKNEEKNEDSVNEEVENCMTNEYNKEFDEDIVIKVTNMNEMGGVDKKKDRRRIKVIKYAPVRKKRIWN